MTAQQDAAEVLAAHVARPVGSPHCICGWRPSMYLNDTESDRGQHRDHQADMLAAAGLLVTPERTPCCVMRVGIDSGYLVDIHDHCTCTPHAGAHERGCGMAPIAQVEGLAEHDAQVAARTLREWGKAMAERYPEDVFVEPRPSAWPLIAGGITAVGHTLDAVSASCMRRAARIAVVDADRIEREGLT